MCGAALAVACDRRCNSQTRDYYGSNHRSCGGILRLETRSVT
jgi:hypothetical protein